MVPKPVAAQSIPPLLLDLDGTLVDSVYEHVMAWREALEELEIRLPNWKIHRSIGMGGKMFLPTLLRELGQKTSKAEVQSIEKIRAGIFRKKITEIRTRPGAKDLVEFFERIGARWAVATSGERWQAEQLLKNFDIPSQVPVITGNDVPIAKPAPASFVMAAERLGVSPYDSIVIGDSPWDLLAAQRMKATKTLAIGAGTLQLRKRDDVCACRARFLKRAAALGKKLRKIKRCYGNRKTEKSRTKEYQESCAVRQAQTHHSAFAQIGSRRARKARCKSRQAKALLMIWVGCRKPLRRAISSK